MRLRGGRLRGHGGLHHKPELRKARNLSVLFDPPDSISNIGELVRGDHLTYAGDCAQLVQRIDGMEEQQRSAIKTMSVHLKFRIARPQDITCLIITFLTGIVFVGLPCLLFFSDCWQRRYRTLFETPDQQYEKLFECLVQLPEIKKLQIVIRDSWFDVQRLKQLINSRADRQLEMIIINESRAFNLLSGQLNSISRFVAQSQKNIEVCWGNYQFKNCGAHQVVELEDNRLI